jgi:hypothetical protein
MFRSGYKHITQRIKVSGHLALAFMENLHHPSHQETTVTNKYEGGAVCNFPQKRRVSKEGFQPMIPEFLFSSGTVHCFFQSSASELQSRRARKVSTTQQRLLFHTSVPICFRRILGTFN